MDSLSPLAPAGRPASIHIPGQDDSVPALSPQSFKDLLHAQPGVGAAPSEAEARIAAAQIASKANVHAGLKREPVVAGMNTNRPTVAATTRFMPLREGAGAARIYNGSTQRVAPSLESLKAQTKGAPNKVNHIAASPVMARAQKAPVPAQAPSEAYAYGLGAATGAKPVQVPAWFDTAVQEAMAKYDAMKAAKPAGN